MCIYTERPKAVVKVSPDECVFRGERVTLTCDIQGAGDIQWTYSWFKDGSVIRDVTERLYSITSVSDRAVYSCRGERSDSQRSDTSAAVTLTVSDLPRSSLTVTPDSPVFTGETVTLKCVIESDYSDWRYVWYKGANNSVISQTSDRYTVNRDTLSIKALNESDQDQYWCRGQRDERPNSSQESNRIHLSANGSGQISVFSILSFLLAACPYLLSTVVLLFKCYRARVTSTEDQSQYAVTEE
ncbi:sialoadhesin-like [Cyprinus carpio]|uniref:Sialoadhesin-like n=1 Tax=Cyprinus carpio TaxID=7962 RepID=A0A9R0AU39_CYPCA|nr:sialoadhesin-like [Cyprinus carpio]